MVARSARKELESLPSRVVERVLPRLDLLAHEPRPSGCRKLSGGQNLWRLRVGDYRIVYSVDDRQQVVDIVAVRHRKDAYR
jgi:mRNA interferase RelE/StbE